MTLEKIPEWKYAKNLYAQDSKDARLSPEDGQAFAFDENEADCSNRSVVAVLSGMYKSSTEIVVEAKSKIDTGGEYASITVSCRRDLCHRKVLEAILKLSVNRQNVEFKLVFIENGLEATKVHINFEKEMLRSPEQELSRMTWDRPPIEITKRRHLQMAKIGQKSLKSNKVAK